MSDSINDFIIEQKKDFTPMELVYRNLKYIPWVILSIILSIIAALIYLRYTPDVYSAKGKMIIRSENPINTSDEKFNRLFLVDAGPNLTNEIAILTSVSFLERVAERLDLNTEYIGLGSVRSTLLYFENPLELEVISKKDSTTSAFRVIILNEKEYYLNGSEEKRQFGEVIKNGNGEFKIHYVYKKPLANLQKMEYSITHFPLDIAAEKIIPNLTIKQSTEFGNIIDISFKSTEKNLAADLVNAIMNEYEELTVEDKTSIAKGTIRFIEERLDSIQLELSDVEGAIQRFRERNQGVTLGDQSELYISSMSDLETKTSDIQVRKKIIGWLQNYLSDSKNQNTPVPVNLGIEETSLTTLIAAYNDLQVKKVTLLKTTTELNPAIIQLNESLGKIKRDIQESLKSVERTYDITLSQLDQRYREAQRKSVSVPGKIRQLLNIERQQKIKEELYLLLLSKKEEVAIASAAVLPNSSILEKSTNRAQLVQPMPRNVLLKYLAVGFVVPIFIIGILNFFNDKIRMRSDIERATMTPIAGEVGRSNNPSPLLVTTKNRSFITEQFRTIRTNLNYLASNTKKPVVLITSTVSGEGKSFVCTNIGAAFALAGKRTLILEFDIRKPRIASNLGISTRKGVSTFLVAHDELKSLIQPISGVSNLFILPCGVIPPNPAELLLLDSMNDLFAWAKSEFDVVVIDSAPVGIVSDAITLSKYADTTLYIVRQNYSLKKSLELIDKLYESKRLPNMSIVINDVNVQEGRGYGYGYGYSYGVNKYGSEYFDMDEKKSGSLLKKIWTRK
jgi:capsular exopolysaccharide synthesis family protein